MIVIFGDKNDISILLLPRQVKNKWSQMLEKKQLIHLIDQSVGACNAILSTNCIINQLYIYRQTLNY